MKTNYFYSILLLFSCFISGNLNAQATIAQWNFNAVVNTSAPTPSLGSGSALLTGGISGLTKSGSTTDPDQSAANMAWQTSSYAPSGTLNKQCGVQFNISTVGYQGLMMKFDQRLSNTANTTYEVQYTADRTASSPVWVDFQMFTIASPQATGTGDTWYNGRMVDFSSVAELNNNANIGIRVVSMFDPVVNNYRSATNDGTTTYSTTGTVRYDMVTFTAVQVLGVNEFASNQKSFFFYPNPTKGDMIHFNDIVSIHVSDILGKEVLKANDVTELNLSGLIPGVYFIRNENGYSTKLIKN